MSEQLPQRLSDQAKGDPRTMSAAGGCDPLAKQEALLASLGSLESGLIAFSGGTDSAYLAWAAYRVLGGRALAVTALSPSFSAYDREHTFRVVRETGLHHEFIESQEFENPLYVANDAS